MGAVKGKPPLVEKNPQPLGVILERRRKGLDTTGKRAKEHKTHKIPLNSSI
jgi:hypothetical protein